MGKTTPKNIIFYTHYLTFRLYVVQTTQLQAVVIIKWKCFEIMVKL